MVSVFIPNDGEWLAPVSLPREEPVAELVIDGAAARSRRFEPFDHLLFAVFDVGAVDEPRIDMDAVARIGFAFDVAAFDDLDDGQIERFGEFVVARIVCRNAHNRPGAVGGQDVIGDPDRRFGAIDGVNRVCTRETARFRLCQIGAFEVGFLCGLVAVGVDGVAAWGRNDRTNEWVFWRQDEESRAKERVGARRKHLDIGGNGRFDFENDFGAERFPDPVALHRLDAFGPIEFFEVLEQAFGIGRNLEHPLAHGLADDFVAADFRFPVDDFFVGQNRP